MLSNEKIVFDLALNQLNKDYANLNRLIEKEKNSLVGKFITRVLSWKTDKEKNHYLWDMFLEVFAFDPINFIGSFGSFVGGNLLDDSAFRIEWRKYTYNRSGVRTFEIVSREDPKAEPVVLHDNEGTQNVKLLLEAMDYKEEYENRMRLWREDCQRQIKHLSRKLRLHAAIS